MAKPPGPGRCVHCLKEVNHRTWDHVFPSSWYPESASTDVEKWKIPSCEPCNRRYGALENDLLIRIGIVLDPGERASLGIPEKAMRAIDPDSANSAKDRRRRENKRDQLLRTVLHGSSIPRQNLYPGFDVLYPVPLDQQQAIPFKRTDIRKLTEKIVRGIFFIEDRQFIEPPFEIHFAAIRESDARPINGIIDQFGTVYAREPGITVTRAVAAEDGLSSSFRIEIWRRLVMYASVDDPQYTRPEKTTRRIEFPNPTRSMDSTFPGSTPQHVSESAMQEISLAIDMVNQLLVPEEKFNWGKKIYEPMPEDQSPAAELKKRLISDAHGTIEWANTFRLSPKSVEKKLYDESVFEEIVATLRDDAESKDFMDLAECTHNLVLVVNHRIKKK